MWTPIGSVDSRLAVKIERRLIFTILFKIIWDAIGFKIISDPMLVFTRVYTPSLPPHVNSMLCLYHSLPKHDANCVSTLNWEGGGSTFQKIMGIFAICPNPFEEDCKAEDSYLYIVD